MQFQSCLAQFDTCDVQVVDWFVWRPTASSVHLYELPVSARKQAKEGHKSVSKIGIDPFGGQMQGGEKNTVLIFYVYLSISLSGVFWNFHEVAECCPEARIIPHFGIVASFDQMKTLRLKIPKCVMLSEFGGKAHLTIFDHLWPAVDRCGI